MADLVVELQYMSVMIYLIASICVLYRQPTNSKHKSDAPEFEELVSSIQTLLKDVHQIFTSVETLIYPIQVIKITTIINPQSTAAFKHFIKNFYLQF